MRGGVEMENAAPMMLDDEEAVQHTETQRGHGEKSKAAITSRWFWRNASQRCTFDWLGWHFSRCR
jgi:hypothetical protein